jgi:hypothetical protein
LLCRVPQSTRSQSVAASPSETAVIDAIERGQIQAKL